MEKKTEIQIFERGSSSYFSSWYGCNVTRIHVWLRTKDGKEHLLFGRLAASEKPSIHVDYDIQEGLRKKDYLERQLTANGGAWANLYGTWTYATGETKENDPAGFIRTVRERGFHFTNTSLSIEEDGSATFHGNLEEYSSAFRYAIFSEEMIGTLTESLSPDEVTIIDYRNEKAMFAA